MCIKELARQWASASKNKKQDLIKEYSLVSYKCSSGDVSFRVINKLQKDTKTPIPVLDENSELFFVQGFPIFRHMTCEDVCNEARQYRVVAVKEDGEEEYSSWYNEEEKAANIQNEIDELEAYESTYIQKCIKGDKEVENDDEAVLEKKCKKKENVKESNQEMDIIRKIRQDLTSVVLQMALLKRSSNRAIKTVATSAEREIDKIRRQFFDIQENTVKEYNVNTKYDSKYVIDQLRILADDAIDRNERNFLTNLADKIFQSYPDRITIANIERDIRNDSNVRRIWDNESWLYVKDQIFESKQNITERNNIVTKLVRELVSTHLSHLKGKQMRPSDVGFIRQVINDTLKAYPSAFRNVDIADLEDMVFDMLD